MAKEKIKISKKKPAKIVKKKSAPKKKAAVKKKMSKKAGASSKRVIAPKPIIESPLLQGRKEIEIGEIEDYFAHVSVIALYLKQPLSVGDAIHVHGHTTDFIQSVESMQIEHVPVQNAKKGDSVGIRVGDKSRKGDKVFKLI